MKKRIRIQTLLVITVCIMMLNSNAQEIVKGIRIPRLTTEQRDLIQVHGNVYATGQFIYNIDIDCPEYWNGDNWIALCQGSSNPKVDIPQSACSRIHVYGQYYKNAPLGNTHYITLPVTVTKKGNYNIIASAGNGYYFQKIGVFEEIGTFELRLDGMGTPGSEGVDTLTLTCNGEIIGSLCTIKITIGSLTMGYRTDCDNIQVLGNYQTRHFMNSENIVKVPIDVIEVGQTGLVTVETGMVNGIMFNVSHTLTALGQDTLRLKASGSPQKAGTYHFTFTTEGSIKTTCTFTVYCTSTLGGFADPACKCLDIYNENPAAEDGEYWLMDCLDPAATTAVKTYCDIKNGGWTLVWSFSERTARNSYGPSNSMTIPGNPYSAFYNTPRNRVTNETDTINYNDFRLTRTEWRHFPNSTSRPQLKVRITENPTNMNDEWALNNYGIISPQNESQNPLITPFNDYKGKIPAEGKIFGKRWEVRASGGHPSYGGWDEVTGNHDDMALWNTDDYCTHWNFGNDNSTTSFDVIPNKGADNNSIRICDINNAFGWFGETEANHHFGKCTHDDYSFQHTENYWGMKKACQSSKLKPHSFNNGQGRYLQWFVR